MAIYICFAHEKPAKFRVVSGIYYHIVYEHRKCFLKIPENYYKGVKEVDFREFVCRCGETGFPTLRSLIVHLDKCQNVKIVYVKGFSGRKGYLDGMPPKKIEKIARERISIKKATNILELPNEIAEYAEELSREFCKKSLVPRTSKVDAASLYVAAMVMGNRVSQREVAEAFGVSEPTIRKWYKSIVKDLSIDMPF